MANYFQDPSQTFVPTPVYRPPFEAIQSTLNTKQQKYDMGLAGVRSTYNSIFNAPLTNGENSKVRSQYLKDVSKQLENLSQVNLSQESNQLEAKKVFGNFFKDPDMVQDMVYTKNQGNEINKFQSFKPEKNGMEYADARSLLDMQNGMDKVRNSKRGDMSVYDVREFTPFTDIQKYMGKMVVDQKIAIESIGGDGTITYKKTNGPESLGSWMTIASAMTQDRFNKQFQVEARVTKESGIRKTKEEIKRTTGQDATDQQAQEVFIKSIYKSNFDNYSKLIDDYKEKSQKLAAGRLKWMTENPDGSVEENKRWNEAIVANDRDLKNANNAQRSNNPSSKEYIDNIKKFGESPDSVLYEMIRGNTINNLANFFASNESQTAIAEDPRHKIAAKTNQRNFDNTIKNQAAKNANEEHQAKMNGTWKGNATGSGRTGANGKPLTEAQQTQADIDSLHRVGLIGNDFKIIPSEERFNIEQQNRYDMAYGTFLDPNSTAGILELASNGTMSYADVVTYTSALKSEKTHANFTPEEKVVFAKAEKVFEEKGIKLDGNNRNAYARALHNLADNQFKDMTNFEKWTPQMLKIWTDNKTAGDGLDEYNNYNTLKNEAAIKQLDNPTYKHLLVDRGNGEKGIVDAGDLAKGLTDITGTEDNSIHMNSSVFTPFGTTIHAKIGTHLKPKEFSEQYLNGNVEIIKDNEWQDHVTTLKGLRIKIKGGKELYVSDPKTVESLLTFQTKWGKSDEIATTFKKANETVIGSLPGYSNKDGQMGQEFTYHFGTTPKDGDKAVEVIKAATLPANFDVAKASSGNADDTRKLIDKIHSWGAKQYAEYMNPPIYHANNGAPKIILSFKPLSEAQIKELGVTVPDRIELPLKANNSPALQEIMHPDTGMYKYGKLLRGKTVSASTMDKGLNFDYDMVPDNTYNPTSVKVIIRTKQLNLDGTYSPMNPPPIDMSFDQYTPDEMEVEVRKNQLQHISRNVEIQRQINENAKILTDVQKAHRANLKKLNDDFEASRK